MADTAEPALAPELRLLQVMARVNQVMLGATHLTDMLGKLLNELLDILDCDRAWLLYPCDPTAAAWRVPMERTVPEWPGALALGMDIPMTPDAAALFAEVLEHPGVLAYSPGSESDVPEVAREPFSVKAQLSLAIHPNVGKPWVLGVHHCRGDREFTVEECAILGAVGQRLGDALSSLVTLRDLRKSEAGLADAQRIARIGNWSLDFDHDRIACSAEARRIYGLPPDAAASSYADFLERVHPDDRARVDHAFRTGLSTEVPFECVHRLQMSDGAVRHVYQRGEVAQEMEGAAGVVGTVQDITDFKRAQNERDAMILELERKNAELERIVYAVSHQLRTPLVTISSFVGALAEDLGAGDTSACGRDLARIDSASGTMRALLDDLLQVIRAGHLVQEVTEFSVGDIVDDAVSRSDGGLERVTLEVSGAACRVIGDRARLVEVMHGLLDNATKFMGPQPAPLVQVSAERLDAAVRICVTDNGAGIEPEYHGRVFDLFERFDAEKSGTGVGLAIVKRVVEHHGGWIAVRSEGAGTGTTFEITLPI